MFGLSAGDTKTALLLGWLSAACATNPSINPSGKTCTSDSDPCPAGFDCYQQVCVAACSAAQQSQGSPDASVAFNVLSAAGCHCTSDCPVGQVCHADPYWVGQGQSGVCETSCPNGSGDCLDPNTLCDGAACTVNTCNNVSAKCDAQRMSQDGTCLPLLSGGAGVCLQGSDGGNTRCEPAADRSTPTLLCPPGQFCQSSSGATQGTCFRVCDPTTSVVCINGSCQPVSGRLGICVDGGP